MATHSKSSHVSNKECTSTKPKLQAGVVQSTPADVSSGELTKNMCLEKSYDTNTIKEELNTLKEELKRQINEDACKSGEIDSIVETVGNKDERPILFEKSTTVLKDSVPEAKIISTDILPNIAR